MKRKRKGLTDLALGKVLGFWAAEVAAGCYTHKVRIRGRTVVITLTEKRK
jgi:hypothetical protein